MEPVSCGSSDRLPLVERGFERPGKQSPAARLFAARVVLKRSLLAKSNGVSFRLGIAEAQVRTGCEVVPTRMLLTNWMCAAVPSRKMSVRAAESVEAAGEVRLLTMVLLTICVVAGSTLGFTARSVRWRAPETLS